MSCKGCSDSVCLVQNSKIPNFILPKCSKIPKFLGGGAHVGVQFGCRHLSAPAPLGRRTLARQELYGCEYLAGCLCADSLGGEDFIETCLAQCVEVLCRQSVLRTERWLNLPITWLPISTALYCCVPLPMRIASNSASVSDSAPKRCNLSVGRSSSAHCLMLNLKVAVFIISCIDNLMFYDSSLSLRGT